MLKRISLLAFCVLAFVGLPSFANAQQRGRLSNADESSRSTVVVRCSYWTQPGQTRKAQVLYYLNGRDYEPFFIADMAFVRAYEYRGPTPIPLYRKATEAEIAQRRAEGVSKSELEYIEVAKIPTKGLRDIGVLIPGELTSSKPVVLDFSESRFPLGSMMVLNMCPTPIQFGLAVPKNKPQTLPPQAVQLSPGGLWTTKAVKERTALDIRAAVPEGAGWKTVFSSAGVFHPGRRSVLFVMESARKRSDGLPALEFRQASVAPKPIAPVPEADDGKKGSRTKGGKNPKSDKPARPKPRRV